MASLVDPKGQIVSAERSAATKSGCYRCGKPVRSFGGIVSPGIRLAFGSFTMGVARWWTDCKDCGRVEVVEPHV